jgi:hypothetical protein
MQWRKFIAVLVIALATVVVTAMVIDRFTGKPPVQSLTLKYLTGPEGADFLSSQLGAGVVEGWSESTVFIRGSEKRREEAAVLLATIDKPKPMAALKFQIIEANGFTQRDTSIARIESVLRGLFRFNGYRLVAEAYIQTKEESAASQMIVGQNGENYGINVEVHKILQREGKASAEVTTSLWVNIPGVTALSNTVNMPDGQTIVLGSTRTEQQRGALILVVTPQFK